MVELAGDACSMTAGGPLPIFLKWTRRPSTLMKRRSTLAMGTCPNLIVSFGTARHALIDAAKFDLIVEVDHPIGPTDQAAPLHDAASLSRPRIGAVLNGECSATRFSDKLAGAREAGTVSIRTGAVMRRNRRCRRSSRLSRRLPAVASRLLLCRGRRHGRTPGCAGGGWNREWRGSPLRLKRAIVRPQLIRC